MSNHQKWILGIDTSAYTTSVAGVSLDGILLSEIRKTLIVPAGKRGLRQAEAVFQHIRNIPENLSELCSRIQALTGDPIPPCAVSVSISPRPYQESYMPVFVAGSSLARSLAYTCNIPLFETSHQEGHIQAALFATGYAPQQSFLVAHLSGGTSELLRVLPQVGGFNIEIIGKTKDLHAGQFIDRVGVALGLPFPAGPELEILANTCNQQIPKMRNATVGADFHFSGPETQLQRWIASGMEASRVARAAEESIAITISKALHYSIELTGITDIIFVGGVTANRYLRNRLNQELARAFPACQLRWASPDLSGDNAVGVALLGKQAMGQF